MAYIGNLLENYENALMPLETRASNKHLTYEIFLIFLPQAIVVRVISLMLFIQQFKCTIKFKCRKGLFKCFFIWKCQHNE